MTQIGFYHLVRLPLEQALPRLLDKALSAGHRVVVMAGSEQRVEYLDSHLWTFSDDAWLPHGSAKTGEAEMQPIWLTAGDDVPNQANVVMLCDGRSLADPSRFDRCLTLFDGNDDQAVAQARDLWRQWKGAGLSLVYYQQTNEGGWVEKAKS